MNHPEDHLAQPLSPCSECGELCSTAFCEKCAPLDPARFAEREDYREYGSPFRFSRAEKLRMARDEEGEQK